NRDPSTGNNLLSIARVQDNGAGGMTVLSRTYVTPPPMPGGQLQAALPSVAVNTDGAIGVLYDTFDGFSGGFPQFTAHFATSTDHAVSFLDSVVETFLSPSADNSDPMQRILGDYQQVKAVGSVFNGVFGGSGVHFGRVQTPLDPIFFRVTLL